MEKQLTPFTVLFDLNKLKLYNKEDIKKSGLNSYLLLSFIKTHPMLVNIASYLNTNWKMDIYQQYLFVYFSFKRFNINNVKWVKGTKFQKVEDIEMIQRYYTIGYNTALKYIDKLSKEKIKEIKDYYDVGGIK